MANITSLLGAAVNAPSGLWVTIINWINGTIGNLGWTIVLFTLLIKLVMSPLDFTIKLSTKKTTLVQQKLAPQMAKLQKKYANNQQMLQVQQQALYKKEGTNMVASCFIMLINLVLTLVVFFTIFSSLREVSAYNAIKQYDNLKLSYEQALSNGENAETAVQKEWDKTKDNWLWISNIWVSDSNSSPMLSYKDLVSAAKNSGNKAYQEHVASIDQETYSKIQNITSDYESKWNGYYILAILGAAITFLSQFISELGNKLKSKKANMVAESANQNKSMGLIMKIILPVMMAIFVLTSSASFGIYILASSVVSTLLSLVINLIVDKLTAKKQREVSEYLEKEALKAERRLLKK